jgi:sarcosine oxidase subunit alpha
LPSGLQAGEGAVLDEIACDAVAMSGGWSPVVHLWSHCGGKLTWDRKHHMFRPDAARPPITHDGSAMVIPAGASNGALTAAEALADAAEAGVQAVKALGLKGKTTPIGKAEAVTEAAMEAVWIMPQGAGPKLKMKMWLDYQNDVKVSDVQLAAREGYTSVEHTKRYTTLGMATDQGKLSNINGLAVLANAMSEDIPAGRHHHLPPALYAGHYRRAGRGIAGGNLPAAAAKPDACLARGQGRLYGARRPVAPALLLSASGRDA